MRGYVNYIFEYDNDTTHIKFAKKFTGVPQKSLLNIQEFSLRSTKFVKLKAYSPVIKHFNKISIFFLMS